MAAAVDQNRTAATADQCWNLITPVATMAKTAMEQDYRRTRSVSRIPDPSAIMFYIALIICRRQRSGPVSFEPPEVVIVNSHADLSPRSHAIKGKRSRSPSAPSLEKPPPSNAGAPLPLSQVETFITF